MYSFGKLIPEVSIVLPVYRNKDILYQLYRQLYAVLENLRLRYEIIFVEDACPEGSLEVLNELANMDPSVVILIMKKNVGQQRAVLSGLKYARGNMVVVMDADLQDPPEAIPLLLTKLQEGYAAVFAGRRGRYESALRLLTSRIFKWLLHLLVKVPSDAGIFVALNWEMVEKLVAVDEPQPFIVAMIGLTGMPVTSVPVQRHPRPCGQSTYSTWKRLKTGLLAIFRVCIWKWRRFHS